MCNGKTEVILQTKKKKNGALIMLEMETFGY